MSQIAKVRRRLTDQEVEGRAFRKDEIFSSLFNKSRTPRVSLKKEFEVPLLFEFEAEKLVLFLFFGEHLIVNLELRNLPS